MRIGWWNTKLKPYGKSEPSEAEVEAALGTGHLLRNRGCRIIALGEVSKDILKRFEQGFGSRWASLTSHHRGLGLLFDREGFNVTPLESLTLGSGAGSHVGWVVGVGPKAFPPKHTLSLSLVHWRTDQFQGRVHRQKCGEHLKKHLSDRGPSVVLGDFNCEPFEEDVTRFLGATRDRDEVAKGRAPFFNPFWSGEGTSWASLRLSSLDLLQNSRWKLVDFGVVSKAFVTGGPVTGEVVDIPVGQMTSDHRPVILSIASAGVLP